jgi:hypothetical protein
MDQWMSSGVKINTYILKVDELVVSYSLYYGLGRLMSIQITLL